jgi:hypothetical protein
MPITVTFFDPPGWVKGHIADDFQSHYTRVIKAEVSHPRCGPTRITNELYAQLGIRIGTPYVIGVSGVDIWYEEDITALATSITPEPASPDGLQWAVTIEYGPWPPREANPLNEDPVLQWDRVQFEEIVDVDVSGVAVQNSAGDAYDPPVTRDQSRPMLIVTRNEEWPFPEDLADEYRDSTNDAPFYSAPTGTVKCSTIKAERDWHQACGYFARARYEFHGDRNGWKRRVRDQGFREIVSGQRKQILIDNTPATDPVPLNGSGLKLAVGGTPVYREHIVYPSKDFTVFNFPGS